MPPSRVGNAPVRRHKGSAEPKRAKYVSSFFPNYIVACSGDDAERRFHTLFLAAQRKIAQRLQPSTRQTFRFDELQDESALQQYTFWPWFPPFYCSGPPLLFATATDATLHTANAHATRPTILR